MPPFSHDIAEEGALFDGLRMMRGGVFDEAAMRAVLGAGAWPARNPDQNVADLKAQAAACPRARRDCATRCARVTARTSCRLYAPCAGQCRGSRSAG